MMKRYFEDCSIKKQAKSRIIVQNSQADCQIDDTQECKARRKRKELLEYEKKNKNYQCKQKY